jgi:putative ABC transport system permease protein
MTVWRLALRNVTRNRRRSLLTGGVVVFGFAAVALAGGFMAQSLESLREGTIRSGMGHLQIARPEVFLGQEEENLENGIEDAARVERIVRQDPDVAEVLPRLDFVGLVTNGARSIPFVGVGLDPVPEARVMDPPKNVSAGRWLADRSEHAVVLGTGLARALAVGVGDGVTLLATTTDGTLDALDVTVVGLTEIPFKELNDRFLATTLGLADGLLGASGRVTKLVVVVRETSDPRAVLARIDGRLRSEGLSLAGRTWEDLAAFYRQVRTLYIGIFGFMGAVLLTVVLLAAANTMLMAVTERVREIGTLRALGTRPRAIRRMLVAEGVVLAAVGCVAGAVLSLIVREALNHSGIVLPPPPGAARGTLLHVNLYAGAYLGGALSMTLTLFLASYFPARRASRIAIVDALTHV